MSIKTLRIVGNLAFFCLVAVSVLNARTAGYRDDCPQPLAGTCYICEVDGPRHYWYNGCEETCEENQSICEDWCQNESAVDTCTDAGTPPDSWTCGDCDCNDPLGPRVTTC